MKPAVVCTLWGKWGGADSKQYVYKLRNMVERHTTIDHDFYCITDKKIEGINTIELPKHVANFHLNIPKFYMHAKHPELEGRRVLFFDLDTVLVGNIDDFLRYEGYLCAIKPFRQVNWNISTPGGVLSFVNGKTEWIWKEVEEKPQYWAERYAGKERFILNNLEKKYSVFSSRIFYWDRWQDILPGQLISYKRHVQRNDAMHNARVIAFHGNPRPHEAALKDSLIKRNWK